MLVTVIALKYALLLRIIWILCKLSDSIFVNNSINRTVTIDSVTSLHPVYRKENIAAATAVQSVAASGDNDGHVDI